MNGTVLSCITSRPLQCRITYLKHLFPEGLSLVCAICFTSVPLLSGQEKKWKSSYPVGQYISVFSCPPNWGRMFTPYQLHLLKLDENVSVFRRRLESTKFFISRARFLFFVVCNVAANITSEDERELREQSML